MSEKKYRIELTEHQLVLMAHCVEDCHRFIAGQTELDHSVSCLPDRKEIRSRLSGLRSLTGEYDWAGNGCPNEGQKRFIQESYYLYREIYHQLATDKAKPEAMGANVYLGETLRSSGSGEPISVMAVDDDGLTVQKQDWGDLVRYMVTCKGGSVIVELHQEPVLAGCRAYLWNLWVEKPYRRNGLATRLLKKAEEIILECGYDSLSLVWEWPTPHWVFDWYQRNGFEERAFGNKCASMVKSLK